MLKNQKKKEQESNLSFEQLVNSLLNDKDLTTKLIDGIELYLRRHHSKNGHPVIIFDTEKNSFVLATLVKQENNETNSR